MIVHRQVGLAMLAVACVAAAVFCYAGYAVAAALPAIGVPDARRATWYGVGALVALSGALLAGLAAWRADPPRRR